MSTHKIVNEFGHIIDVFNLDSMIPVKDKFWRSLPIAMFDTETTGLDFHNPDTFRICQIAIGIYKEPRKRGINQPESFKNWFIRPGVPMHPVSIKIHGVYDSTIDDPEVYEKHGKFDVATSPSMEEVIDEIIDELDSVDVWSAYNGLSFDLNALNSELFRLGREQFMKPTLDPFIWFLHSRGNIGRRARGHTLSDAGRSFGATTLSKVDGESVALHDARVDIQLLNDVVWGMAPTLPATCQELFIRQSYLAMEHFTEVKR